MMFRTLTCADAGATTAIDTVFISITITVETFATLRSEATTTRATATGMNGTGGSVDKFAHAQPDQQAVANTWEVENTLGHYEADVEEKVGRRKKWKG